MATIALTLATAVGAGDLNPPPGAIQATNRVILNEQTTTLPYTISEPGSYVLTSNLMGVAGQPGIRIASGDVTIDLNGFALIGVPDSLVGIDHVVGEISSVTIKNGAIRGWGEEGIRCPAIAGLLVDGIHVSDCQLGGIYAGSGSIVRNCTAVRNPVVGLWASGASRIVNCTAVDNEVGIMLSIAVKSGSIESCASTSNDLSGIMMGGGTVTNCAVDTNAGLYGIYAFQNAVVESCSLSGNHGHGIYLEDEGVVRSSVVHDNDGTGIVALAESTVVHCTATRNGYSPPAARATAIMSDAFRRQMPEFAAALDAAPQRLAERKAVAREVLEHGRQRAEQQRQRHSKRQNGNRARARGIELGTLSGTEGIDVGNNSTVIGCTAHDNAGVGILGLAGCSFIDCTATDNGARGLQANEGAQIRGCTARNNDSGISVGNFGSCAITDCIATANTNLGIATSGNATISGCTADNNGTTGLFVIMSATITNCRAYSNGGKGIDVGDDSLIESTTVASNGDTGISADGFAAKIRNCTSNLNNGHGIVVGNYARVQDCSCDANTNAMASAAGISAANGCSILRNSVTSNDIGVQVTVGSCLVVQNWFSLNSTYTNLAGTNTVGPLVTNLDVATDMNPHSNYAP